MKSLATRVLSTLVAIGLLYALYFFAGEKGFVGLCVFAVLASTRELSLILFAAGEPRYLKFLFALAALFVFAVGAFAIEMAAPALAATTLFLWSLPLIRSHHFSGLAAISNFHAKTLMGLLYVGLLPAFACQLLFLEHGLIWFFTLLAVVFAGDTMAYLTGMSIGSKKILPLISPKKTLEGALGGVVGAVIAMILIQVFLLPHIPLIWLIPLALILSFFAQAGDFFESLLKRVADIKDSGNIMPGHGGVLDRLDGVLFATPFLFISATFLERFF